MAFQFSVGGVDFDNNNLNGNGRRFSNNRGVSRPITSRAGWFVPLLIGLIFTAIGVFLVYQSERSKDWPTANATVQSVDRVIKENSDGDTDIEYRAVLEFTVDGKSHTTSTASSSAIQVGNTREVRYNPENPGETQVGDTGIFAYIFGGIGLIVALFAIFKIATFKAPAQQPATASPVVQPQQSPEPTPFVVAQPQQQPLATTTPQAPTQPTTPVQQQQPSAPDEANQPQPPSAI